MANAKKCDRCGKFYTSSEKRLDSQGRYLKGITMDGLKYTYSPGCINQTCTKYQKQVDLCPDCSEKLILWLNAYNSMRDSDETHA